MDDMSTGIVNCYDWQHNNIHDGCSETRLSEPTRVRAEGGHVDSAPHFYGETMMILTAFLRSVPVLSG